MRLNTLSGTRTHPPQYLNKLIPKMPLLRISQTLVDDIVNVANMAKDVSIPQEVVRNGIIISAARLSDLGEQPDMTTALVELREEYNA